MQYRITILHSDTDQIDIYEYDKEQYSESEIKSIFKQLIIKIAKQKKENIDQICYWPCAITENTNRHNAEIMHAMIQYPDYHIECSLHNKPEQNQILPEIKPNLDQFSLPEAYDWDRNEPNPIFYKIKTKLHKKPTFSLFKADFYVGITCEDNFYIIMDIKNQEPVIIGKLCINQYQHRTGSNPFIEWFEIYPNYRKKGYAADILNLLKNQYGVNTIQLDCDQKYLTIYQKLGGIALWKDNIRDQHRVQLNLPIERKPNHAM